MKDCQTALMQENELLKTHELRIRVMYNEYKVLMNEFQKRKEKLKKKEEKFSKEKRLLQN